MRAVQLFPTKLLGVVADHGSFPIERIAVDQNGEGRWVGSAGHEEMLKMTDLKDVFEDEDDGGDEDGDRVDTPAPATGETYPDKDETVDEIHSDSAQGISEAELRGEVQDSDSDAPKEKKRRKKGEKDSLAGKKKKGRNEIDADPSFFSGL